MSAVIRCDLRAETVPLCSVAPRRPVSSPLNRPAHHAEGGEEAHPGEIGFTSGGLHVRVEFGVTNGLAGMTVFVAPADADTAPGMGVLHVAPPPEQARAIGRALVALADAAERGA